MKRILFICTAMIVVFSAGTIDTQAKTYNLTVQADRQTQQWNKFYEKGVATCHQYTLIDSYWKRSVGKALRFGHDSAGFQYWRGHGILHDDVGLVKAASATSLSLNWTNFDKVYDTGRAVGMYPICEIGTTPAALAKDPSSTISASYNNRPPIKSPPTKYGWGQWIALMDSIVKHVEHRYGADEVRDKWYFEVWNEPNWWYESFSEYVTLYTYTAAALKKADPLIRIGGPACQGNYTFTLDAEISKLLNQCHTATNPITNTVGVPIDFLTWHVYADNPIEVGGVKGSTLNANTAVTLHRMMIDSLKSPGYSWFKGPSFGDETGPTSRVPVQRDMHQTASWLARTVHLLNEGGPDYPPPGMLAYWSISDIYQEGMNKTNNLTFQEGNYGMLLRGSANYAPSWDIPKPVFQAYRLLHKLGAWEDSSFGGITTAPAPVTDGVGIVATSSRKGKGNDSLQILVYNHYASTTQSSAPKDSIVLTVDNIPWLPGAVRVDHFAIDTIRGNTYTKWVSLGKPDVPTNAQWDELRKASDLARYDQTTTVTEAGSTFTKSFSMNYFSVHLIVLSNPHSVSAKKKLSGEAAKEMPGVPKLSVHDRAVILNMPQAEKYRLSIHTTGGRKIFQTAAVGPGSALIKIPKIPAGTFVVECRGTRRSIAGRLVRESGTSILTQ
jgi:xylan 1,4-beta-xylosidase